jgi:hypothetical protein
VVACFGFQLVIIISNTVHRALCTVTHPPTRLRAPAHASFFFSTTSSSPFYSFTSSLTRLSPSNSFYSLAGNPAQLLSILWPSRRFSSLATLARDCE